MNCMIRRIGVVFFLAGVAGCLQPNARRGTAYYVENGDMISGQSGRVTMYDLDSAAQCLMRRMRSNETFRKHYESLKRKRGDVKPLIAIGAIRDLTDECIQPRLDSVRNEVSTSFYESEMFHVRDDTVGPTLGSRIGRNMSDGLENGALEPVLETHPEPDYLFMGDCRRFCEPGGYCVYRLHFSIQDLSRGIIMWEGEETVVKKGPSGCFGTQTYWHRYKCYRGDEWWRCCRWWWDVK